MSQLSDLSYCRHFDTYYIYIHTLQEGPGTRSTGKIWSYSSTSMQPLCQKSEGVSLYVYLYTVLLLYFLPSIVPSRDGTSVGSVVQHCIRIYFALAGYKISETHGKMDKSTPGECKKINEKSMIIG